MTPDERRRALEDVTPDGWMPVLTLDEAGRLFALTFVRMLHQPVNLPPRAPTRPVLIPPEGYRIPPTDWRATPEEALDHALGELTRPEGR